MYKSEVNWFQYPKGQFISHFIEYADKSCKFIMNVFDMGFPV